MKTFLVLCQLLTLVGCSEAEFAATPRNLIKPGEEPVQQTLDVEERELSPLVEPPVVTEEVPVPREEAVGIPGIPAVKVGINFEDLAGQAENDRDFNDAVLCFEGAFRVDDKKVVSVTKQDIIATTSSISGCMHDIEVLIVHADGTSEAPVVFPSRMVEAKKLAFRIGDSLNVSMTPTLNCNVGVKHSMTNPDFAKILIGVCNTTGR